MNIRVHQAFLPHLDADASTAFYRDALGFEVREDVGSDGMRWLIVGSADPQHPSLVLGPPNTSSGVTDAEHHTILELMAKGVYGRICLATHDVVATFSRLEAHSVVEVIQEPITHPSGGRDCAFLDPAGNVIRIIEDPLQPR